MARLISRVTRDHRGSSSLDDPPTPGDPVWSPRATAYAQEAVRLRRPGNRRCASATRSGGGVVRDQITAFHAEGTRLAARPSPSYIEDIRGS